MDSVSSGDEPLVFQKADRHSYFVILQGINTQDLGHLFCDHAPLEIEIPNHTQPHSWSVVRR
jgi:hypothetical protein